MSRMSTLSTDLYLNQVAVDTNRILSCLLANPHADVPTCPGWDVSRLAGHVGRVHRMANAVVSQQLTERPTPNPQDAPPTEVGALNEWITDGLRMLTTTLSATRSESPAWNFAGQPQTAAFWPRRMAHETAVHRADAQRADGHVDPLEPAMAIDGISEFLTLFAARVLPSNPTADLGGTLHLHATDGDGEWMIALTDGKLVVDHSHGKGAAAVRGTASDLMLGMWGRLSLSEGTEFDRFGDPAVVERLTALGAF